MIAKNISDSTDTLLSSELSSQSSHIGPHNSYFQEDVWLCMGELIGPTESDVISGFSIIPLASVSHSCTDINKPFFYANSHHQTSKAYIDLTTDFQTNY